MRTAAAMVTIACCAALLLSACDSSDSGATSGAEPTEDPGDDQPQSALSHRAETALLDRRDAEEANAERGSTIAPGTYTYTNGPFPVTYTTTEATIDLSRGGDPYRILLGDPYGVLGFDFPVNVADLSQQVTAEDSADGRFLIAGPIDVPADTGAWLDGAVSLDVVDEGTLSLADGDASWWDVEVTDPSARCFPDSLPDEDACVVLWPYLDDQDDRQIGEWVLGSARVYVIESGSEPLMVVAGSGGAPEEAVASWLATTDEIVSSIALG